MDARERRNEAQQTGAGGDAGSDTSELDRARADGERFLSAGEAAIRRALSGDSEGFLRANRQRGGE
jgi:hypothetical protein